MITEYLQNNPKFDTLKVIISFDDSNTTNIDLHTKGIVESEYDIISAEFEKAISRLTNGEDLFQFLKVNVQVKNIKLLGALISVSENTHDKSECVIPTEKILQFFEMDERNLLENAFHQILKNITGGVENSLINEITFLQV